MPLRKLASGFLNFRENTYKPNQATFEALAAKQQPKIMMVACSDSRVDPAILMNAESGDIFTVRNVANLVPPCALDDSKHGTSAALEFAVTALRVEHIVVCGHSRCGGIQALLTGDPSVDHDHTFIFNWIQIADEARRRTLIMARNKPLDHQLRFCGQEAIKTSLANLLSFPWIEERVVAGTLRLHGWYFDIEDSNMYVFVPEHGEFEPLTLELIEQLQNA